MNVIVILCDTLRRDHCGPYNLGKPLNECGFPQAPSWRVPTPNIDRLAARGVVFDHCYCGSTPCMPARRDIYTGKLEFLRRGWGPLEEEDLDLPRQVSGEPNLSVRAVAAKGLPVSYLITDHFHLWEQGSGNYHMGYTGFEFVRGNEADAWRTDPADFPCPPADAMNKNERHWRNVHFIRRSEADYFPAQVFSRAADWLTANHTHESFYLHVDCFAPHEPWDAPEELVKLFDPRGYDVEGWHAAPPYSPWRDRMTESQMLNWRARYAANVLLTDRWLGRLLDQMDRLDLWKNTMVIFTTDHGTFNGDRGRLGKLQTHEFDSCGRIPFIVSHPHASPGRRQQLVQLVDIYPTVLSALGRPCPGGIHGVDLLPVLADQTARTRDYALAGQFGRSVTITDGRWNLHQSPAGDNTPLYWYGHCLAKFIKYNLGPYQDGRREVRNCESWREATWLSDKQADPAEMTNLASSQPAQLRAMQAAMAKELRRLEAPAEQLTRLGIAP
jgi:arylsulfatase A-like enzyme